MYKMICKNTVNVEEVRNYQIYLDRGRKVINTRRTPSVFGNKEEMLNVLIYGDEYHLDADGSNVRRLAFALAENPYLKVRMVTEPKSEYAQDADVVVVGFDDVNPAFYKDIEEYNNSKRLILTGKIEKRDLEEVVRKVYDKTKELEKL